MSQQPRHRAADHSRHKASHRADNPAPKHVKAPGADPRNQANPAAQHTGANPYLDSKEGAAQTGYRAPAPNPVLSSDAPIGHTAHGFKPVREVGGGKHKISKQKRNRAILVIVLIFAAIGGMAALAWFNRNVTFNLNGQEATVKVGTTIDQLMRDKIGRASCRERV